METKFGMDLTEEQKERIVQLNDLDKIHQKDFQHTDLIQQKREKWHDRFIKKK